MKRLSINIYILSLIGALFFWTGCDSVEFPPDPDTEIIFFIDGTMEGETFLVEAGKESVYLFTDYNFNTDNVYEFNGNFEKTAICTTDCDEAISITINNYALGAGINMNNALFLGTYPIASNMPDSIDIHNLTFQATASGNSMITKTDWNFGDGESSNQLNPSHIYSDVTNALVRFETKDLFGTKSHVEARIDLENNQNCITDFYFTYQNNQFNFYPIGGSQPNYSYEWAINSPSDSTIMLSSSNATFSTPINYNDLFQVCLNITLPNGCTSQVCKKIDGNNQTLASTSFFNYTSISTKEPKNPLSLSQVNIEYTDSNGIIYSNKKGNQSSLPNSYFEVIRISDYDDNENGQKTKKIEAKAKILLFNDNGASIEFKSDDIVFAVAYPN